VYSDSSESYVPPEGIDGAYSDSSESYVPSEGIDSVDDTDEVIVVDIDNAEEEDPGPMEAGSVTSDSIIDVDAKEDMG